MTTLLVDHLVSDYATWRPVYDSVDDVRSAGGVTSHRVLRFADDPNHVIVEHVFADAASAGAFLENAGLREAMMKAGVIGDSVRPMILEDVS